MDVRVEVPLNIGNIVLILLQQFLKAKWTNKFIDAMLYIDILAHARSCFCSCYLLHPSVDNAN
jgi:energy-converting hydrogenase A subunit M